MKTFRATITSAAYNYTQRGIVNLYDDGSVIGGDNETIWQGFIQNGYLQLGVTEDVQGAAMFSMVTGQTPNQIVEGFYPARGKLTAGPGHEVDIQIHLKLLREVV